MINLSYRFDQNSSSLELAGMPDVSNGDSEDTIGILSSWSLKIIGYPLLEGEKEHLEYLMQVILQYSRSYISGIRKTFTSNKNIVTISPDGIYHKLLLNSDFLGKNRELDSEKIVFFILDLEKNLNNQLDLTSLLFNEDHQMNTFEDLKNIILEKIK